MLKNTLKEQNPILGTPNHSTASGLVLALASTKGKSLDAYNQASMQPAASISWINDFELELVPACATAGGEFFLQEPVWCLKQALGLPGDLWQRCTATRVKEHLSMCSDAASYPIVQCPPVPLLGKLSSRSLFTSSTLLTTDSKLSWKRYRWGRMLRQSLFLICPIILTSLLPFWPPLVPAYPLRVAASTTQSSP